MKVEEYKVAAARRLMQQCRASKELDKCLMARGMELCLETLGLDIKEKPLAPGSNQGLEKINTPSL